MVVQNSPFSHSHDHQVKDPRYGRNSELPGEDTFLSGTYAVHYLQGMQQMSSGPKPRFKMLAYVKHYTAYVSIDRADSDPDQSDCSLI